LKAVFSDLRGGKKVFKPGFQICHGKRRLSFPVGKFEIRLSRLARRKESLQGRFSNLPPQKKTFVSGGKFEIRLSRLTRRKESFQPGCQICHDKRRLSFPMASLKSVFVD
jgi:hypothetical protein